MRHTYILFFSVFILLYVAINYYIGVRLLKIINILTPLLNIKVYWSFYWLFSLSYVFGRFLRGIFPYSVTNILTLIGSYWLGIMFYSFIFIFIVDIVRLLDKWLSFIPNNIKNNNGIVRTVTIIGVIIFIGIMILGIWNAKSTKVVNYTIDISKNAGDLDTLNIVVLSDIHLGVVVNEKEIQDVVNIINKLDPDLVLFAGDTVDEDVNIFKEKNMAKIFQDIKSKFGKYAILGNHEYISNHVDEAIYYIEKSGIKVLKDNYIKINDSFYLAGRDDLISKRMTGKPRKELSEILQGVDGKLPIILLDHQPYDLNDPMNNGVDLQISGHTHKGQLYPTVFIINRIFENGYGYFKKGNLNTIVSSGFGTWGPPMRIGSRSEILNITVNFK